MIVPCTIRFVRLFFTVIRCPWEPLASALPFMLITNPLLDAIMLIRSPFFISNWSRLCRDVMLVFFNVKSLLFTTAPLRNKFLATYMSLNTSIWLVRNIRQGVSDRQLTLKVFLPGFNSFPVVLICSEAVHFFSLKRWSILLTRAVNGLRENRVKVLVFS